MARRDAGSLDIRWLAAIGRSGCFVSIWSISFIICCRRMYSAFGSVSPLTSLFRVSQSWSMYFQLLEISFIPHCSALNLYFFCLAKCLLVRLPYSIALPRTGSILATTVIQLSLLSIHTLLHSVPVEQCYGTLSSPFLG
jgi:hypothetical protein